MTYFNHVDLIFFFQGLKNMVKIGMTDCMPKKRMRNMGLVMSKSASIT